MWNSGLIGACEGIQCLSRQSCAQNPQLDIINLMIEKGANELNEGLRSACTQDNFDVINLMIEKGANDWNNGLNIACTNGNMELVHIFVEKGAIAWDSSLHNACSGCLHCKKSHGISKCKHLEIVNIMFQKCINLMDTSAIDSNGYKETSERGFKS